MKDSVIDNDVRRDKIKWYIKIMLYTGLFLVILYLIFHDEYKLKKEVKIFFIDLYIFFSVLVILFLKP